MISNRVRRRDPTPQSTYDRVVEMAGLGAPAFFIDAGGVNATNSTWTDAAGGFVGTFENAGFSVNADGGRRFVSLSNCRCEFPTGVFSAADTAVAVIASIRPPSTSTANMNVICQANTASDTYSWAIAFTHSNRQLVHQMRHVDNNTLVRSYPVGAPSYGRWGLVTVAAYEYAAGSYPEGATSVVVRSVSQLPTGSLEKTTALALQGTSNMPLYVGGGRVTAGGITKAYNGDIEWIAVWKVPATPLQLQTFRDRYLIGAESVRGFGTPPAKAPRRTLYLNPYAGLQYPLTVSEVTGIPTYATGASSSYGAGDLVLCSNDYVCEIIGVAGSRSDYSTAEYLVPKDRGGIFRASLGEGEHLVRLALSTKGRPAYSGLNASVELRRMDTLAVGIDALHTKGTSYPLAIDASAGASPDKAQVPALFRKKTVYVTGYDAGASRGLGFCVQPALHLSNGVFVVRDLKILGSSVGATGIGEGSLKFTDSIAYVERVSGSTEVRGVNSTVYLYDMDFYSLSTDMTPIFVSTSGADTLSTIRERQLSYGKASTRTQTVCIGGYMEMGMSSCASMAVFSKVFHGKTKILHSTFAQGMSYTFLDPRGNQRVIPIVDTEAPGGAYVEVIGGSFEDNASPTVGAVRQSRDNMLRAYAIASVKTIAADINSSGVHKGFHGIGTGAMHIYKTDMTMNSERPAFSVQSIHVPTGGVVSLADSPLRARTHVELVVDVREQGERTFEIDFILESTDTSIFSSPKGLLSVAAYYYGVDGLWHVYRDTPLRYGYAYYAHSAYTLTQKNTSITWAGANPAHVCGSRVFTLSGVARGSVRIQVFLGVSASVPILHPVVKVT